MTISSRDGSLVLDGVNLVGAIHELPLLDSPETAKEMVGLFLPSITRQWLVYLRCSVLTGKHDRSPNWA